MSFESEMQKIERRQEWATKIEKVVKGVSVILMVNIVVAFLVGGE